MTNSTRILCTVCARGGSKGIPEKNLRELCGKPLIVHSIETARAWGKASRIVVSTDSETIASVAHKHGADVPFMRPDHLATDDAPKLPTIQHATKKAELEIDGTYDYIVDLGVAAPLRTVEDIQACFQTVAGTDANNAYTVTEADKSPYFNMVELDDDGYASLSKPPDEEVIRRQDAPTVYEMNSSVYVYERDFLMETDSIHSNQTRISPMPPERSVDIDRPVDLEFARLLVSQGEVDIR